MSDLLTHPDAQKSPPFVAGVLADELCQDPSLLSTWCSAFEGYFETSLKIVAVGDPATVQAAVVAAMNEAGVSVDDERDLELQICRDAEQAEREILLGAQAILTRRRCAGALEGMAATANVAVLRTLAVDWWTR